MASHPNPHASAPAGAAPPWRPSLGCWPEGDGARFRVWAPEARTVEVVLEPAAGPGVGPAGSGTLPLRPAGDGTFAGHLPGVRPGDRYRYKVDGEGPFPDPASRFQPEGVHGPSEVVDPDRFAWTDAGWAGVAPENMVVYELHVGTFSPEGTFEGATRRLADLKDLGVTAVELMPLADFAGDRSWGYDGVDLFAPSRAYGRPDDLRRLVDAAHALGLAVLVDVVYNHFGPVGNYTLQFSKHYLSGRESAWAACVNLHGPHGDKVQEFFIENALHWVREYHVDGLRLDATHALHDDTPPHFLETLTRRVHESAPDRHVLVIAEDHRNLDTMLRPPAEGGWGLDGVWADDFHHQARRLLAGDDEAYYRDFTGSTADLAKTINQGWFYTGQHSLNMDEHRGTDPSGIPPRKFVVCLQNHDQVGNRAMGERLHHQIDPAAYRAASALLLCVPEMPLLFMGQEWAASAPFQYFTDHDEDLGKIVTEGRRKEFGRFRAFADPETRERIPDPQAPSTFEASRLDWSERDAEPHASTRRMYRAWLHLRQSEPALRSGAVGGSEAVALDDDTILLRREAGGGGPTVWLVARLRGSGSVALPAGVPAVEPALTTEEPPFAPEPTPVRVEAGGPSTVVHFARPSAVLLRAVGDASGGASVSSSV